MTTPCHRRESAAECKSPGDFAWRFAVERDAHGEPSKWRAPTDGERPTHVYLIAPDGRRAHLAIAPERQSNGANWDWDGHLDRPTLHPSIDARDDTGVGWHGFLRAGVLTSA